MKKIPFMVAAWLCVLGCANAAESKISSITVEEGTVTIGTIAFQKAPSVSDLETILGKASGKYDLMTTIHTWDSEGVFAYTRDPAETRVKSVSVDFVKRTQKYNPKTPYSGTVKVAGQVLTGKTKLSELQAMGFKEGMAGSHILAVGSFKVYVTMGPGDVVGSLNVSFPADPPK